MRYCAIKAGLSTTAPGIPNEHHELSPLHLEASASLAPRATLHERHCGRGQLRAFFSSRPVSLTSLKVPSAHPSAKVFSEPDKVRLTFKKSTASTLHALQGVPLPLGIHAMA